MLGAPSCSSLLLTPHAGLGQSTFGLKAPVVYEETPLYDGKWDNGDSHIQTCRRPDVLKPWLMWKAKVSCERRQRRPFYKLTLFLVQGKEGLAAHVRHVDALAQWTLAQLKARPYFRPVLDQSDTPRIAFSFRSQAQPLVSRI